MTRNELLEALAEYGYELKKPTCHYEPMDVLFNLVKEKDARLLEGFPVVYERMLSQKPEPDWQSCKDGLNKKLSKEERKKFDYLLLLSYLLLRLYDGNKSKLQATEKALKKLMSGKWKTYLRDVEDKFNHSGSVKVAPQVVLSAGRLKNQFRNYVVHGGAGSERGLPMDMELDVLLSEFFTPKQKEVLKKRLRGEALSKTEKEYYYRVVGKRLRALGNDQLHDFAKHALLLKGRADYQTGKGVNWRSVKRG